MTGTQPKRRKRQGGRPTAEKAGRIKANILDIASALFLEHGYEAVSIETVAKTAGISKRTFYHRFTDKADLFTAVIHYLTNAVRPPQEERLFEGRNFETVLRQLADAILKAALMPQALALHRLLLTEAARFPELAGIAESRSIRQEAIDRIAQLFEREIDKGTIRKQDARFLAEQFLHLVMTAPQRRAMGLGKPFTPAELKKWAHDSVELFLGGCLLQAGR